MDGEDPIEKAGTNLVRGEHEFDGPQEAPPAVVQELVVGWTRGEPVNVVARISTRRRRLRVFDERMRWVEIGDDEVTTDSPHAPSTTFHEVEIELLDPNRRDDFQIIVDRVRTVAPGSDEPVPKIARALGAPGLLPADVQVPEPIGRRATTGELVQWCIATAVHRIVTYDHLVRLGNDPEAVHQARVATRRLRADLQLFAGLLQGSAVQELEEELQWFAGLLGEVRDADVLLARLSDRASADNVVDEAQVVIDLLAQVRADRRVDLLDAMVSSRYLELLADLTAAAKTPPFRQGRSDRRASKHVADLLRRPWNKLRRTVQALPHEPDDDQLHDVRKRAKHLRYAAEAVEPVTGNKVHRVARRASRLQDILGQHHDAIVAAHWLTGTATSMHSEAAFAAGELAASFQADAQSTRRDWRRAWKRTRQAFKRI